MRRRILWLATVAVLAVSGLLGSLFGASYLARSDAANARDAFVAASDGIASTLKLALQHEQDLATAAGAVATDNSALSRHGFITWTNSIRAFQRYPELQSIYELTMVRPSSLSTFEAVQTADPSGPLGTNGVFTVSPAGSRPYYCLVAATQSRTAAPSLPAGFDYCTTTLGAVLLTARDTGADAYLPYKSGQAEEMAVGTAIYRGGVVPTTVAARRAALIGWTGTAILPNVVLATALSGHRSTEVVFEYGTRNSGVSFKAGTMPDGAQSTTINLHNGWHIVVYGNAVRSGLLTNGSALTVLLVGIVLCGLLGALIYVLGTSRSRARWLVGERTGELQYQAFHDSLTDLPNRALVLDRIGQALALARRANTTVVAFFLDLDNFKDVNDTLGHRSGDELLVEVGSRLKGALREGDTVGRLGGDEFVIVSAASSGPDLIAEMSRRIFAVLEPPIQLTSSKAMFTITASIGIAVGDRSSPEDLIRDADIALYRAKTAGKNRAEMFTQSMQVSVDDHRNLELDLRAAMEADEFFLLYQPMVNLQDGAILGFEALLRWNHPSRGVVPPNEFIPTLESTGMIVPVGRWVLETACRQGAAWQRDGHEVKVSVNVATVQLQREGFADHVSHALSATGFNPRMLVLELTETTLMLDREQIVARLNLLKDIGVQIAIDDFGTGFSSLSRLQHFPIDILKIDQSFVSQRENSDIPAPFVRTIVQLGKELGLEVVAEGIETVAQWEHLVDANVDAGQGFLFSRPLGVTAAGCLLNETNVTATPSLPVGPLLVRNSR